MEEAECAGRGRSPGFGRSLERGKERGAERGEERGAERGGCLYRRTSTWTLEARWTDGGREKGRNGRERGVFRSTWRERAEEVGGRVTGGEDEEEWSAFLVKRRRC